MLKQTNLFNPHPVRDLKLLSEPCFCHQQLFPNSGIASELYVKIRETCMPRGEFKRRYWFFDDGGNGQFWLKIFAPNPLMTAHRLTLTLSARSISVVNKEQKIYEKVELMRNRNF
jgi:hypothetical protein